MNLSLLECFLFQKFNENIFESLGAMRMLISHLRRALKLIIYKVVFYNTMLQFVSQL